MSTMTDQIRKAAATTRAEAATAWEAFDVARTSAKAEGADLDPNGDNFAKLTELSKAFDLKRDEANDLDLKAVEAERLEGMSGPPGLKNPIEGGGGVPTGDRRPQKTWGERLTENDIYKALKDSGALTRDGFPLGTSAPMDVAERKELVALIRGMKTLITSSDTSGGAFSDADRQPGWVNLDRETPRIANLVTAGTTDSDVVEWVKVDSRTNAAAETAEAVATGDGSGAAPESAAVLSIATSTVRDITHFLPATKRSLADAAQLETFVDAELRDGVLLRLDQQLLVGNGTAPNLRGILNTSGINTQALGADSRSDAIHKAITQVRLDFFEPTAIVLNPTDYEQVVLEKDLNAAYIYGPPSMPNRSSIWGLAVVPTTNITVGTGLLGDFRRGATLWVREGLAVSMSDSHSDFFIRRMVAIMAVMRVAFAAWRPSAFSEITGI